MTSASVINKQPKREIEYQLVTAQVETTSGRTYVEVLLGGGDYAQVYLAKIRTAEQTTSAKREVAAKLYNDEADQDMGDIFRQEVQSLRSLGWHEHIVGLRGVDERYPPTFVCEECGDAFHRTTCPDCAAELENVTAQRVFPSLQCRGAQTHDFVKNRHSDVEKLSRGRPCGHNGSTHAINFLFRPCLFLDVLDLNLAELQQLLQNDEAEIRGHKIQRCTQPDDWQRQVFLIYIKCLYQASEGLAHVHLSRKLHADLSPHNIMVSMSPYPYQSTFADYPIRNTCLIDLGEARAATDLLISRPPKVKRNFAAPERIMLRSSVQGPVAIEPEGGAFKIGQTANLSIPGSGESDLACGDLLRDQFGGEYIVEQHEGLKGGGTTFHLRILKVPSLTKPPSATNFQINMDAGTRLPIDIYAFGSVAAWLLCGGQIPIVQVMQTTAREASEAKEEVTDQFLENFLRPQKRERLMRSLVLPDSPEDQRIRERLLLLIFRCLVRGRGAYAESRAASDPQATTRLVCDIRQILEDLHFLHRARPRMSIWMQEDQLRLQEIERNRASLASKLEEQSRMVSALVDDQNSLTAAFKEESQRLITAEKDRNLAAAQVQELRQQLAIQQQETNTLKASIDTAKAQAKIDREALLADRDKEAARAEELRKAHENLIATRASAPEELRRRGNERHDIMQSLRRQRGVLLILLLLACGYAAWMHTRVGASSSRTPLPRPIPVPAVPKPTSSTASSLPVNPNLAAITPAAVPSSETPGPIAPARPASPRHRAAISALLFRNDGNVLFSGDASGVVLSRSIGGLAAEPEQLVTSVPPVRALAIAPRGNLLAVANSGETQIIELANKANLPPRLLVAKNASELVFSPNSDLLALRSDTSDVTVFKIMDGTVLCSLGNGDLSSEVINLSFRDDKTLLILDHQGITEQSISDCKRKRIKDFKVKKPVALMRNAYAALGSGPGIFRLDGSEVMIFTRSDEDWRRSSADPSLYTPETKFRFFGTFLLAWIMNKKDSVLHVGFVNSSAGSNAGDELLDKTKIDADVTMAAITTDRSRLALGTSNAGIIVYDIAKQLQNRREFVGDPAKVQMTVPASKPN